jgi:hypothetical protein
MWPDLGSNMCHCRGKPMTITLICNVQFSLIQTQIETEVYFGPRIYSVHEVPVLQMSVVKCAQAVSVIVPSRCSHAILYHICLSWFLDTITRNHFKILALFSSLHTFKLLYFQLISGRKACTILDGKPKIIGPLRRPRHRWEDNFEIKSILLYHIVW